MPGLPAPRIRTREYAAPAALLLAALLALGGCGGSGQHHGGGDSSPSASASGGDKAALDPGAGVAKVGQCTRMTAVQSRASVAPPARVGCGQRHTSVVAYIGYVAKPVTPLTPVSQRTALGKKVCEPAFRAIAGGTLVDRAQSLLTWTLFTPGSADLKRGARWLRCDVLARSGDTLVPLPEATPLLKSGVSEALRVCQSKAGVDVSCAGPHVFKVTGVFQAPGTTYPGVTTVEARQRCQELTGSLAGFFQPPSREGWTAGDRFVRCLSSPATTATPTPTP